MQEAFDSEGCFDLGLPSKQRTGQEWIEGMKTNSPSVSLERENPMRHDLMFGLLSALLFLAVIPVAVSLFTLIKNDSTFTHIPLIPLVSLYFFFRQRKEIHQAIRSSKAQRISALIAGVCSLLVYASIHLGLILNNSGDILSISIFLLWLAWFCGFVSIYGTLSVREAAFPLLFMILAIPIPSGVLTAFIEILRQGSAAMVSLFMSISGTTYIRQGTLFHMEHLSIDIAPECSGIRSSIALLLTSLMAGQLYLNKWWKKAILVFAGAVLMIVKNGIRITTLSLLAQHVDERFLTNSSLHSNGGVVFFAIAFILLLAVLFALREKGNRKKQVQPLK